MLTTLDMYVHTHVHTVHVSMLIVCKVLSAPVLGFFGSLLCRAALIKTSVSERRAEAALLVQAVSAAALLRKK